MQAPSHANSRMNRYIDTYIHVHVLVLVIIRPSLSTLSLILPSNYLFQPSLLTLFFIHLTNQRTHTLSCYTHVCFPKLSMNKYKLMRPHSQAAPGLRMGSMPSLLDTPERVGDPVPQFPPPKQSPGVVENPEQGPFLPSVRLGGGRSKVTASLVSKAPP